MTDSRRDWKKFGHIDSTVAAERILGVVRRTPLVQFPAELLGQGDIDLRLKLENRQETGSFKARGAWNQISQLTDDERAAGVVAASSGNHGKALSWAAQRAGVHATIVMPEDAYPNKIEACREFGAEVVLAPTREGADDLVAECVTAGHVLIHPYASERTLEGAGTVGLEIAEDWPEVEVVVVCVGGGGLIAGSSLAIRRTLGEAATILGAEPAGAPSLYKGLRAGEPVYLPAIQTEVQGLCPIHSGQINIDICRETLDGIALLSDPEIFTAQHRLVAFGETVEPAGAAAAALVFARRMNPALLRGRGPDNPLRVAAVVSGGNADPAQLEAIRCDK